jgi:uncharacterized protein (DUF433 family)
MSNENIERMTAAEIRQNYAEAKDPEAQIQILADLNLCKKRDIRNILEGKTDELPPPTGQGRRRDPRTYYVNSEKQKEILERYAAGETLEELATAYNATVELIAKIITGTYKTAKKNAEAPKAEAPEMPEAEADPETAAGPFPYDWSTFPSPASEPRSSMRSILDIAVTAFENAEGICPNDTHLDIRKGRDSLSVEVSSEDVTVVIFKSLKPKERAAE